MKWLKKAWNWLKDREPAQLNAIKTSVVGLIVLLGVNVPAEVEGHINASVAAAVVILTEVQALLTRFGVISPKTNREEIERAVTEAARHPQ